MESKILSIAELPLLQSLCWQGKEASIASLSEEEVLSVYERNWRYRGVIADLGEEEAKMLLDLAMRHHSWLVNELRSYEIET